MHCMQCTTKSDTCVSEQVRAATVADCTDWSDASERRDIFREVVFRTRRLLPALVDIARQALEKGDKHAAATELGDAILRECRESQAIALTDPPSCSSDPLRRASCLIGQVCMHRLYHHVISCTNECAAELLQQKFSYWNTSGCLDATRAWVKRMQGTERGSIKQVTIATSLMEEMIIRKSSYAVPETLWMDKVILQQMHERFHKDAACFAIITALVNEVKAEVKADGILRSQLIHQASFFLDDSIPWPENSDAKNEQVICAVSNKISLCLDDPRAVIRDTFAAIQQNDACSLLRGHDMLLHQVEDRICSALLPAIAQQVHDSLAEAWRDVIRCEGDVGRQRYMRRRKLDMFPEEAKKTIMESVERCATLVYRIANAQVMVHGSLFSGL